MKRPQYLRLLAHPSGAYRDVPIGPRPESPRAPELTTAKIEHGPTQWLRVSLQRSYLPPLATIDVAPGSRALARLRGALPAVAWSSHSAPLVLVTFGVLSENRMAEVEAYAIATALRHLAGER